MALTKESSDKLKSRLPVDYASKIAARFPQYTAAYIRMIASGTRDNSDVLVAIIELAEQTEQAKRELEERIANL